MLPYLTFWCLSNFYFFHFAGKQALKYKAGRVRVNKAYSINIDNNLNKKWECLHHCWVRWIGISMKKAMFDKKQSVLEGEAMDDGRWMHIRLWWHQYACGRLLQGLVYAYVSLDKMAVARNLMCRTSLFCTWTLTDTERWSTKKGGERERERKRRQMKMQTCSLRRFSSYLVRSLLALFSLSLSFFCCAGPRPKNT